MGMRPSACSLTQERPSGGWQLPCLVRGVHSHAIQRHGRPVAPGECGCLANLINGAEAASLSCEIFFIIKLSAEDADREKPTTKQTKKRPSRLGNCQQNDLNRNVFSVLSFAQALFKNTEFNLA